MIWDQSKATQKLNIWLLLILELVECSILDKGTIFKQIIQKLSNRKTGSQDLDSLNLIKEHD